MRRSFVLSLPLQLVFLAQTHNHVLKMKTRSRFLPAIIRLPHVVDLWREEDNYLIALSYQSCHWVGTSKGYFT